MITSQTRLLGLIGDPVAHSLSPAMHNAALAELGLDYAYLAFRVAREDLAAAVASVRALGLPGLNVTIPHKVAVMPLLDEIDSLAADIGAVNTIVNRDGRLKGYNTDAGGFLQALQEAGATARGKRVALLGAGGAARAVAFAVADMAAELTILNRACELDWAQDLARHLNETASREVKALVMDEANLTSVIDEADILINATSVGMSPHIDATPVPQSLLRPGLTVFDIVYNPPETRLLREAAAAGCRTIGGLAMLVAQGALSFELWTGLKPDSQLMRQTALQALEPIGHKTSLALIGFMGSGKSTVCKLLARKLGKKLVEIDKLIIVQAGKPITRIFKEDGEAAFRKLEADVISALAAAPGQVVDCGGGIVLNPVNIERLKQQAVVVYLQANLDTVLKRVGRGYSRPLLNTTDRAGAVKELMQVRGPLYEQAADIIVDTSSLRVNEVANEIIIRLKKDERFYF
jgi:shikimate dehydrogenase